MNFDCGTDFIFIHRMLTLRKLIEQSCKGTPIFIDLPVAGEGVCFVLRHITVLIGAKKFTDIQCTYAVEIQLLVK